MDDGRWAMGDRRWAIGYGGTEDGRPKKCHAGFAGYASHL